MSFTFQPTEYVGNFHLSPILVYNTWNKICVYIHLWFQCACMKIKQVIQSSDWLENNCAEHLCRLTTISPRPSPPFSQQTQTMHSLRPSLSTLTQWSFLADDFSPFPWDRVSAYRELKPITTTCTPFSLIWREARWLTGCPPPRCAFYLPSHRLHPN